VRGRASIFRALVAKLLLRDVSPGSSGFVCFWVRVGAKSKRELAGASSRSRSFATKFGVARCCRMQERACAVGGRSHPPYGGLACGRSSGFDTRAACRHDFPRQNYVVTSQRDSPPATPSDLAPPREVRKIGKIGKMAAIGGKMAVAPYMLRFNPCRSCAPPEGAQDTQDRQDRRDWALVAENHHILGD